MNTARDANLSDLADLLEEQHARKFDVVAPARAVRSDRGVITLYGTETHIDVDGVTRVDGRYRPTAVALEGLASRLDVPVGYLKRIHEGRPDVFDATVNGLIHGGDWHRDVVGRYGFRLGDLSPLPDADPDGRSFLIRTFRPDGGGEGICRAVLSDRYKPIDNLDVLMAALDGVRRTDLDVQVDGCDLTERNMYVRVSCPEVAALAPTLLDGYRSPYSGDEGAENPTVFAGFVIANSEVGSGAFSITPRLVVEVCSNGMTVTEDAMRHVHLGAQMDDGVIRWSEETEQHNIDLVASQAKDAVETFLDVGYVESVLDGMRQQAGVDVDDPADAIEEVGSRLRYTQEQQAGILDHFIRGGQTTAGGVMQAVTSYAQTVDDADTAADLEASALRALDAAAAVADG